MTSEGGSILDADPLKYVSSVRKRGVLEIREQVLFHAACVAKIWNPANADEVHREWSLSPENPRIRLAHPCGKVDTKDRHPERPFKPPLVTAGIEKFLKGARGVVPEWVYARCPQVLDSGKTAGIEVVYGYYMYG